MTFDHLRISRRRAIGLGVVVALTAGGTAVALDTATFSNGPDIVSVRTNSATFSTTSTGWVTLPNTTASVAVPTGRQAYIRARFSAESQCANQTVPAGTVNTGSANCNLRMLVDGSNLNPQTSADSDPFAFDSVSTGTGVAGPKEGHAVERVTNLLSPGEYTLRVQVRVNQAGMKFLVDDSMLSVERMLVPTG